MTAVNMAAEPEVGKALPRKRRFIRENETPEGALSWASPAKRALAMRQWRNAVGMRFNDAARVLRVAWTLEWLFGKDGFAYATDAFIERETHIPIKKIQAALLELEQAGAIIRASVYVQAKPQRRIWPSTKIAPDIFPTVGNINIPHDGSSIFPTVGGQKALRRENRSKSRLSTIASDARRDAERRERRALERAAAGDDHDR